MGPGVPIPAIEREVVLGAVAPIRQGCAHPVSFARERAYSITSRAGVDGISPGSSPERTGKIAVDARRRDSNPRRADHDSAVLWLDSAKTGAENTKGDMSARRARGQIHVSLAQPAVPAGLPESV